MELYESNADKILKAVLFNDKLMRFGDYDGTECATFDIALASENPVVHSVALIIKGATRGTSDANIYKEVTNYLRDTV